MEKFTWFIKDLIDLEYFLHSDEGVDNEGSRQALLKRDRDIYLNKILPLEKKRGLTPKNSIRIWLEQIRKINRKGEKTGEVLPGETFQEAYRLMGFGLLIVGILSGSGLAFSFLNYKGIEPLNVSYYLAIFVFTQFFAVLLLLVIFFACKMVKRPFQVSIIYTLISRFLTTLISKINQYTSKNHTINKSGLDAVMGMIRGKRQIYGSLFYWPVFILIQIFGIGFNLGTLGATFVKVLGADIAFGWQSTVQVSDQFIFKLVQVISFPWSWLITADFAHPSFYHIQGSHMILKNGIYHLSTKDMVSWWPFLCFAVVTYGLLPRLLLLVTGITIQKRVLSKIDFRYKTCEKLQNRMRTPQISTEGSFVKPGVFHKRDSANTSVKDILLDTRKVLKEKGMVVLIPDDIFETFTDDKLESVILKVFGYPIQQKLRFDEDEEGDNQIIHNIFNMKQNNTLTNLLILQEAWQPPIRENLLFIRKLRKASGKTSMIWVGLIGRPVQGRIIFTPVKDEDWIVWNQKLDALGDPYMGIEKLIAKGA